MAVQFQQWLSMRRLGISSAPLASSRARSSSVYGPFAPFVFRTEARELVDPRRTIIAWLNAQGDVGSVTDYQVDDCRGLWRSPIRAPDRTAGGRCLRAFLGDGAGS